MHVRIRRVLATTAAGVLLAAASVGTAYADDIRNDVATSDETVSLEAGGAGGAVTMSVQPRNGDGQSGCNLQGGETAIFAPTSSDPAVATVSPTSITFEACGDVKTVTVTPHVAGTASVTLSQTFNNSGGTFNVGPAAFTVVVTAPVVTNTPPFVGVTGFTDGDTFELGVDELPTPGCSVQDAEDAGASAEPQVASELDAYGLGTTTVTCEYTDTGDETASASASFSIVDTLAPVITHVGVTPAPNDAGWNNTAVTATWTCVDEGTGAIADSVSASTDGQGAGLSLTGTCTDRVGHSSSDTVEGIDVDTTAPSLSWTAPIADDSEFYFGSVPPEPGCEASDALSGPAGPCSVDGYGTAVGDHDLTATAVDNADNRSELTTSYRVLPWATTGYHKPVDMGDVLNTVRNGSTVPLKFEVFAGPVELTSTAAIDPRFTVQGIACPGASTPTDSIELTTTGGTSFRYDTTAGQFVQNWQTPKKAGACYAVGTTLADGSSITATFLLK